MLGVVTFLCLCCSDALAQSAVPPPQYPEIAWLARSTYCNPYFGFRLTLPAEFRFEPIYLPVQPHGQHVLLAMHLLRLDRSADILISAFADRSNNPARLAAKTRAQQAHERGLATSGPSSVSVHAHQFYRLQVVSETHSLGNESSYFVALQGHVLHVAIFSHERDLAATLGSAIEHHLEFVGPGETACAVSAPVTEPATMASSTQPATEPARIYYGPALPTDLVEATLRAAPGNSVPSGPLSGTTFTDPALGIRLALPPGWQPLPNHEAYRVTELMRDPTSDPESTDRRRALFRACSRVLFTAVDPRTELVSLVHPMFVVAAMPLGCVPDMVPPKALGDRAAPLDGDQLLDFATVLVRSLGVPLLGRGSLQYDSESRLTFHLDGTLPYRLFGEKLSRRLSLRVSTTANGPWLIFVYSVTPTPAAQRDVESHIAIASPDATPAK